MGTLKRRSRHKVEDRDAITLAWDEGRPPPQEAGKPDKLEEVIDLVFFRWADTQKHALRQPYLYDWLQVLRHGQL